MSKKYIIVEHIVDDFNDELGERIYNDCFFDDKSDAERIAAELEAEYENDFDYNEVIELSPYHDTDEDFVEQND